MSRDCGKMSPKGEEQVPKVYDKSLISETTGSPKFFRDSKGWADRLLTTFLIYQYLPGQANSNTNNCEFIFSKKFPETSF